MSVFKKLKGTFQSAQQDIVEGFRALASLDVQPKLEQLRDIKSRDINLDTGGDLLQSYQKVWSSIQNDTQDSARKAQEVSSLLTPMFKIWDRQARIMSELEQEVKAIPQVLSTVEQLHTLLDYLRQDFAAVEKAMDMLENLCEEMDMKRMFGQEQLKLSQYRTKKEVEAEKVKVELANLHAKKMAELESTARIRLQERAEAFTSAFQEDVDFYKKHGHADRLPTEFPTVSSLSDIMIEEDKQALDCFLGPDTDADVSTHAVSQKKNLELVEDGTYIEDDYITGFTIKQDSDCIDDSDYLSTTEGGDFLDSTEEFKDVRLFPEDAEESPNVNDAESSEEREHQLDSETIMHEEEPSINEQTAQTSDAGGGEDGDNKSEHIKDGEVDKSGADEAVSGSRS